MVGLKIKTCDKHYSDLGERRKERDALKVSSWNMDSSEFSQCDEKFI